VFAGINGVGKSSLIQALLLLRQSHLDKRLPKQIILNGKYHNLGRSNDVFNIHTPENEGIYIALETTSIGEVSVETTAKSTLVSWLNIENSLPSTWTDVAQEPLFAENKSFQYLQAERISPKASYNTNEYDVTELRSLGNSGEYTAHFIARHKDNKVLLPSLLQIDAINDTLLAQLDTWLSRVSNGVRIISNLDEAANSARISYQFEDGNELTPEFSPVNVGFGLTYVLPVLVSVLAAKPGDLVIIENPESHLHPSGQSAIGQFLALAAQDGVQIIIETHSDHVINGIRVATKKFHKTPEEQQKGQGIDCKNTIIYFFERYKNEHTTHIIPINLNKEGRFSKWPKSFFDEWDKMLDELLE
jgi:predicted ATPase